MTFLPEPVVEENFYWEDFGQLISFWGILPNSRCMRWFHNLLWLFFLNYKKWGAIVEAHVHLKSFYNSVSLPELRMLSFIALLHQLLSLSAVVKVNGWSSVTPWGEGNGDGCAPRAGVPTAQIRISRLCGRVLEGCSCSFPSPTFPVHVTRRCLSVGCSKWRLCFIPLQTAAGDYTLKIITITFLSPKF